MLLKVKPSELLGCVSDLPRWVETRSLLLNGRCTVYGKNRVDFVVRSLLEPLLCVVGKPAQTALLAAITASPADVTILAAPESCAWVQSVLPEWECKRAVLHQMPQPEKATEVEVADVRFCQRNDILAIPVPERELQDELLQALEFTDIAAAFVAGQAVSFCYAGAETERLWDVAIDTLMDFRRQGYAEMCFRFLLHQKLLQNKLPVWGAEFDNLASQRLARKLGFLLVDRLFLFRAASA